MTYEEMIKVEKKLIKFRVSYWSYSGYVQNEIEKQIKIKKFDLEENDKKYFIFKDFYIYLKNGKDKKWAYQYRKYGDEKIHHEENISENIKKIKREREIDFELKELKIKNEKRTPIKML